MAATSVTVGAIIARARVADPRFTARRVSDKTLAIGLTDVQRRLLDAAQRLHAEAVSVAVAVAFRASADNASDNVGAGLTGGLAALVENGQPLVDPGPAGWLLQQDADTDVVVRQDDRSVSAATATTLTRTAIGWTVNAFVGDTVRIKQGLGAGQRREILSNTADTLTVSPEWDETPDATSIFDVTQPTLKADGTLGVVTRLAATETRTGYLLTFDASGQPTFDLSLPVAVAVDTGVPLPPTAHVLGGTVRYASGAAAPLHLLPYADRFAEGARVQPGPSAYIAGGKWHPIGGAAAWADVASVELRVIPFPDDFTSTADAFVLPRTAEAALVAAAALRCAEQCVALEAETPGAGGGVTEGLVQVWQRRADEAARHWLDTITRQRRGRAFSIREVW
jgi:hypothetical protein